MHLELESCAALYSFRSAVEERERSGVEARADADLRFEELGDRTPSLGGFHGGIKLGFVTAGDGGDEVEVALGDGETVADFVERYSGGGFQFWRGHSGAAELRGKRHGETSRVGCGEELFRGCADAVFKARAERILRLFEDAAVGRDRPFAVFQPALPDCRCFALHDAAPFALFAELDRFESPEFDSPAREKSILAERLCRVSRANFEARKSGAACAPAVAAASE